MLDSRFRRRLEGLARVAVDTAADPRWFVSDERWERDEERRGTFTAKSLVVFGDSHVQRWPARRTFGRLPIRTRGREGDLASHAFPRFDETVVPLKPAAVLVLLGTNDLLEGRRVTDIAADVRNLSGLALEAGIRPTIASVLPVGPRYARACPPDRIRDLNEHVARDCRERRLFFLDFWKPLADAKGDLDAAYSFDDLNPNLSGFRRMTEIVLEVFYCRSGQWKRDSPSVW